MKRLSGLLGRDLRIMSADRIESVSISDIVVAVTEKAILLEKLSGQAEQRWIAKSLILDSVTDLDDIQVGDEITIAIPRWLAERSGLED